VLFGPVAANVGAAVIPIIEQNKLPTVWPIVSDDDVTQRKPVQYIVRTGWTSSQTTHVLGDYAYKTLHDKTAATIAYDFNFGWQSIQGFADTFMTDGGKIDKELWTPIANTDFSSYFSSLPRNVDAIMCSFSGQTAINFFKQYREFGMKTPVVCQGNATDESTLDAEGPATVGVVTALHYSSALDTPANRKFVAAYKAAFGHRPGYYGEGGYVGAEFLDKGLQSTHGQTSDALALVKAMHGISLPDAPRGPISFDSYGNPVENVYIRKVQMVNGELTNVVIKTYPKVTQFWTWSPQDYLGRPAYGRSSPACNACSG
jgi:branched-chain amino acid transport system substrate-binding protein